MNPSIAFLELIKTDSLPLLGAGRRSGVKASELLLGEVRRFCAKHDLSSLKSELAKSAALLWHDDLEASHKISQGIQTREGSFLHGIMHRREPNASNAKYWFGLVGEHPAFEVLASSVKALGQSSTSIDALLPDGTWEPFRFVDACIRAAQNPETQIHQTLQRIQQLEFEALIAHLFLNDGSMI